MIQLMKLPSQLFFMLSALRVVLFTGKRLWVDTCRWLGAPGIALAKVWGIISAGNSNPPP